MLAATRLGSHGEYYLKHEHQRRKETQRPSIIQLLLDYGAYTLPRKVMVEDSTSLLPGLAHSGLMHPLPTSEIGTLSFTAAPFSAFKILFLFDELSHIMNVRIVICPQVVAPIDFLDAYTAKFSLILRQTFQSKPTWVIGTG